MKTIILAGWREGLQKVELANLQREVLQLSLKEAKENVDRLLEVEAGILPTNPVVLQVPDDRAAEFSERADELGVLVGLVSFSAPNPPIQRPTKPTTIHTQQAA